MKIAELIGNNVTTTDRHCDLLVSGEESVRNVLQMMLERDCDYVGIDNGSFENTPIISKEELLNRLLAELDDSCRKVMRLQEQIDRLFLLQNSNIQGQLSELTNAKNENLSLAANYLHEGLVIISGKDEVEFVNPAAKKALGLEGDCDDSQVCTELDKFGFMSLMDNEPTDTDEVWCEYRVKNGNDRMLKLLWADMRSLSQKSEGKIIILKDVTDEQADEKAKSEFIAAITHELRTPLTIIQNSVSNILAGVTGRINKKTTQYLNTILSDCHRFDGLVSDLLDISKIETGKMSISRSPVEIKLLVEKLVSTFSESAKIKNIEIVERIDKRTPVLYIDYNRIFQVMSNLMSNAVKHSKENEKIVVRVVERKSDVVFSVEDRGTGIANGLQNQIFDKFHQIDRQAGAGYKGTGLGLAICSGIMAMHGGSIWVESEVGLGSKFYISLPKADQCVILNKYVQDCAARVNKKGGEFALVSVNFRVLKDDSNVRDIVSGVLKSLLEEKDRYLLAKKDMVFSVSDTELYIVTHEAKRINNLLKNISHCVYDFNAGFINKLYECGLGWAVYPHDTKEILEIENLAKKRAATL